MLSEAITAARVADRAGIGDAEDATLAAVVASVVPAIGATLHDGASGPEVELGVSEIVTAEYFEAVARDGSLTIDGLRIEAPDVVALRARGEARLAPYLRDARIVRAAGPR